mmetsp:Transcript_37341/g.49196  ORF Transcript_37341/g.49196 Transcript_37341/m.49196 type:complete len:434 (-) Transcript_37341:110-1411(-)
MNISDSLQNNIIIPSSALLVILGFLNIPDLSSSSTLSKQFEKLASSDFLWEKFCITETKKNPCLHLRKENAGWKKMLKSWRSSESWCWKKREWPQTLESDLNIPSRYLHRMATCPTNKDIMYVFGGSNLEFTFCDTWRFENIDGDIQPHQISFHDSVHWPSPRFAASLTSCWGCIFLFGGASHSQGDFHNDVWCLSQEKERWVLCKTFEEGTGNPTEPEERWAHTMVPFKSQMIMFGGSAPGKVFDDLWILEPKESLDHCHTAVEDGIEVFKGLVWQQVEPTGNHPSSRCGHAAVIYENFMYVHGGNNATGTYNDLWRINLDTLQCWEELSVQNTSIPAPRIGHSMFALDEKLIVYGGRDLHLQFYCEHVAIYDLNTSQWEVKALENEPKPRTGHSAVLWDNGILMFGGFVKESEDRQVFSNELHFLSFSDRL